MFGKSTWSDSYLYDEADRHYWDSIEEAEYEEAMRNAPPMPEPTDEELDAMARAWEEEERFQERLDEFIDAMIEAEVYGE